MYIVHTCVIHAFALNKFTLRNKPPSNREFKSSADIQDIYELEGSSKKIAHFSIKLHVKISREDAIN